MKVISNGWSNEQDIIIEEFLEPTGAFYAMDQGEVRIDLGNKIRVQELIDILKFIIKDD